MFQALKHFLPDLRDHHVLVRTDNTAVVSYINHQGGLRSRPLYRLAYTDPWVVPGQTPLAESSSHSWASQYGIALLPGVLARVRRDEVSLLLVAPFWPGRVWFSDLISLLDGSPWEIPVRRDLLSQAGVYHPRPDMWKLWGWPLRGHNS